MKYHVNAKGEPGRCSANAGKCPFGGEDRHHESAQEARSAYEARMTESLIPAGMEKKDLGLKALNELAKVSSDQDVLTEVVMRGSERSFKNLAKNPNADSSTLALAALRSSDEGTKAALYDHPNYSADSMPIDALAERLSRPASTRAFKLSEADCINDAHLTALKKLTPDFKNVNVQGMLRNSNNNLSQDAVVELAERSWLNMGAAQQSNRYPAGRIKDLPKALVYWGNIDRTDNPAYLEGYADWAIGQKEIDQHNSTYYAARVAANPETPASALKKLAQEGLALPEVALHPRATDEVRALCAFNSPDAESALKVARLQDQFGGKLKEEIVYMENANNPFGSNRGITDVRVRFNTERMAELGLDANDVHTLMGRGRYNGGASFDPETGIFKGTIDSTD